MLWKTIDQFFWNKKSALIFRIVQSKPNKSYGKFQCSLTPISWRKKTSKETRALIHSILNHYRVNLRNKGFFIKWHWCGKDHSTKNTKAVTKQEELKKIPGALFSVSFFYSWQLRKRHQNDAPGIFLALLILKPLYVFDSLWAKWKSIPIN